jgi:hypothetical protein
VTSRRTFLTLAGATLAFGTAGISVHAADTVEQISRSRRETLIGELMERVTGSLLTPEYARVGPEFKFRAEDLDIRGNIAVIKRALRWEFVTEPCFIWGFGLFEEGTTRCLRCPVTWHGGQRIAVAEVASGIQITTASLDFTNARLNT